MIEYTTGNLFESNADCLINTVNCEGFMGKGIAYQFKMKFPENNRSYVNACKSGELTVGRVHYYIEKGITIINFPTKDTWRAKSKMEYITSGMDSLVKLLPKLNVKKIAIPPLGCGNGGLIWADVKEVIENKISDLADKYDFIIFEPSASSSYRTTAKKPPQLVLPELILLDIRLNLKKFNRIRLQKAAYWVNFFEDEEYFKFDRWEDGPISLSVDSMSRNIREYQIYYKIESSQRTFEQLYQIICSKQVDAKFNKLHKSVKKATEYVNSIKVVKNEKKLEAITAVLYFVQTGLPKNKEQLISSFKKADVEKKRRFDNKYISACINYLEDTSIISVDLCGNYELTRNAL